MSRTLVQPVGQKRLTNVAVVRLKKHGNRFEIACFKNKVLSWRSAVEKDVDEVLQSHTVYTNVSKGVLAKSKDLIAAFQTDDQTKICLEILDKGELQVAGKEREAQFLSQFRDIATIVMQKTINPETKHPYTISMIERLMHEIHFAVDPHSSSKKQALEVIRQLQNSYPIKRSPMRLRITISPQNLPSLLEELNSWNAEVVTKDDSESQLSVICELDPGVYRECDKMVRTSQGKLEILAVSIHFGGDSGVDHFDEFSEDAAPGLSKEPIQASVAQLSERLKTQAVSASANKSADDGKQSKCNTCNVLVGDTKQYREHFKSDWHRHNVKRKTKNLPPLSADECSADLEFGDLREDLKEYSF